MHLNCKLLSILCFIGIIHAHAQSEFEQLGSSTAIVLDLEIDEGVHHVLASTTDQVELWDYHTKTLVRSWPIPNIHNVAFTGTAAAGISKFGTLVVWDLDRDNAAREYKISTTSLLCLTWIDSDWIVVGTDDGVLLKINSQTGEVKSSVKSKRSITAMVSLPHEVIVGSSNGDLEIYDAIGFNARKSIQAHKDWIREIRMVNSAGRFFTISDDAKLMQWDSTLTQKSKISIPGGRPSSADYVVDNFNQSLVAIGRLNARIIIRTSFGDHKAKANAAINKIILLQEDLPQLTVVVATHGGGIQIWNAKEMKFNN